jgi:hypothetical protein
VADEAYFTGKVLKTPTGDVEVTPQLAKQIYKYLLKNDYSDDADRITGAYHDAKKAAPWPPLPAGAAASREQVFQLIDSVFSEASCPRSATTAAQEEPAQRQLRQAGVQGAVEPDQSQGGVQRALRLRRAGPEGRQR